MLLEYALIKAANQHDDELQEFLADGWQIKEILPPPSDSEYYRFVLIRPKL